MPDRPGRLSERFVKGQLSLVFCEVDVQLLLSLVILVKLAVLH